MATEAPWIQNLNAADRQTYGKLGVDQSTWGNYSLQGGYDGTEYLGERKAVLNPQALMQRMYNPQTGAVGGAGSQLGTPSVPTGPQAGEYYTPEGSTYGRIKGGTGYTGMERPDYIMLRDPKTGQLQENFQLGMGDSYGALKDKAMAQGDTPWAQMMRQKVAQDKAQQMGSAVTQGQSQVSDARNRLATTGGLTRGASERLESGGMGNLMRARQEVGRGANLNNLNISLQDEANKNQWLGQLGGVEQKIQAGNVGNLMRDIVSENELARSNYGEDMGAWAAEKSGEAQERAAKAGKSGGLLSGILDVGSWF